MLRDAEIGAIEDKAHALNVDLNDSELRQTRAEFCLKIFGDRSALSWIEARPAPADRGSL